MSERVCGCVYEGRKCQRHAIFRPDWHTAKSRANCCFSHIPPSLFTICPPSLSLCVSAYRSLFSLSLVHKLSLSAQLMKPYVYHLPPPPIFLFFPSEVPQGQHISPQSHRSSISTVSGLKTPPISISYLTNGVISGMKGKVATCVGRLVATGKKKKREKLSHGLLIYLDQTTRAHNTNHHDSDVCTDTDTLIHTQIIHVLPQ